MSPMLLGQPKLVGEMIASVVIKPSLLGLLSPDMQAHFFPRQARSAA